MVVDTYKYAAAIRADRGYWDHVRARIEQAR